MSSPLKRDLKRSQIRGLYLAGHSESEIAVILGFDLRTVKKWAYKDNFSDQERSGRPTKLTPQTKSIIMQEMRDKVRASTRKCARRLNFSDSYIERAKKIDRRSIIRFLRTQEWGQSRIIRPSPMLSAKNIRDRLTFALDLQLKGYAQNDRFGFALRRNILMTDESIIMLQPPPNRSLDRIRTSGPILTFPTPKFHVKIMVAAGISRQGKTELIVIPRGKTVNAEFYRTEMLPIYIKANLCSL